MGLTFLQPMFLLGALTAALPVIIHLIYRRRALVHRFPAMRFLLLADRRTARKFRLSQWLLLALRVLAILLLTLSLARPYSTGSAVQAAAFAPPQATVFLVDNSLSMQYRDGQESRLQRAKTLAGRLVHAMAVEDTAVVLPFFRPEESAHTPVVFRHEQPELQEQLATIQPSHAQVDIPGALQHALALLHTHPAPRRRLVVLSDFTMHGWETFHLSALSVVPEQVKLHFIRLGSAQRDANVLITDVRLAEKPFIEHAPLDITAVLHNRSTTPLRNVRVDLLLGTTTVGQQLVDLGPEEQLAVPFRMTAPPAGLHWGEVRLEGDTFVEDDQFYYALRTVSPVRMLLVDGDPSTSLFESEVFYVLHALQPRGVLGKPLFFPKPIPWEGLEQERLSDYQVILLCNVEALSPQVRQRLYQFVSEGGGLVFFVGNRVDPVRYNAMLYRSDTLLLPLALGQPLQRPPEQPLGIQLVDRAHEALAAFASDEAMLQRAKVYRYLTVDSDQATPGVRVLLTLQDGRPLLVEKELGRGRIMLFTTSADRDWTDLPTRTAYVPLMHGLVSYAARLAAAAQRPGVIMPDVVRLLGRTEDEGTAVTITTPDSQERLARYTADDTRITALYSAYTVPGIYRLTTPAGADFLSVNGTRAESNFEKIPLADLQTRWRPLTVRIDEEETFGQTTGDTAEPSRELASVMLLALGLVLAVESVYANRV